MDKRLRFFAGAEGSGAAGVLSGLTDLPGLTVASVLLGLLGGNAAWAATGGFETPRARGRLTGLPAAGSPVMGDETGGDFLTAITFPNKIKWIIILYQKCYRNVTPAPGGKTSIQSELSQHTGVRLGNTPFNAKAHQPDGPSILSRGNEPPITGFGIEYPRIAAKPALTAARTAEAIPVD